MFFVYRLELADVSEPQSLEHIVEQLVLQNVEIQRILQRQKRRLTRAAPPSPVSR